MKVAFIARSSSQSDSGGDTVQIEKTAEALRVIGVEVDIHSADREVDTNQYDILHFFNMIRPSDFLIYTEKKQIPIALSTIYVNYSETDRNIRTDVLGKLSHIISPDAIEYLKTIAKWLIKGEKIASKQYLFLGHRRSVNKLLDKADILLPNSNSEYQRVAKDYVLKGNKNIRVIPNAVDMKLLDEPLNTDWKSRQGVICVGRIEPRKNQLNLIKAANELELPLALIGKPGINHKTYYDLCRKEAGPTVHFLNRIPLEELVENFRTARVHILPSWFETTGLSSLEAGACGCNVVVTDKGDTAEYFDGVAWFCDPSSVESMKAAIRNAYDAPQNLSLREKIKKSYTWNITAKKTLDAYKEVLKLG